MVIRWTPATAQKGVQNMTYKELQTLIAGKDLPCGGTNDEGETVIIEHEKNDGDPCDRPQQPALCFPRRAGAGSRVAGSFPPRQLDRRYAGTGRRPRQKEI